MRLRCLRFSLLGGPSGREPRHYLLDHRTRGGVHAEGRLGRRPGQPVLVGGGLAAVVTETIEPDRVRVRLEYVGN